MNSERVVSTLALTSEQLQVVEDLAGINYTRRDIALYLGVNYTAFKNELERPESDLAASYKRGKLISKADIELQMLTQAKAGNTTAMDMWVKSKEANDIEQVRQELINGTL